MKIEITNIEIIVNDEKLSITANEAKDLYAQLNKLFGPKPKQKNIDQKVLDNNQSNSPFNQKSVWPKRKFDYPPDIGY